MPTIYPTYAGRVQKLDTPSLERRRQYADMGYVWKALHDLFECSAVSFGRELKHRALEEKALS